MLLVNMDETSVASFHGEARGNVIRAERRTENEGIPVNGGRDEKCLVI